MLNLFVTKWTYLLLATEKPEIVGITETWIHTNMRDFEGEFEIPGYKTFKKDRLDREGGGVMLYVRGHLDPVECKIETEHEMVGVVLNKLEKKNSIYILFIGLLTRVQKVMKVCIAI